MKKLITLFAAMLFAITSLVAIAQTDEKQTVKKEVVKQPPSSAKPADAKLKKDGTPDKRFKENKTEKPVGPLKKDGTPDKRYKGNKN